MSEDKTPPRPDGERERELDEAREELAFLREMEALGVRRPPRPRPRRAQTPPPDAEPELPPPEREDAVFERYMDDLYAGREPQAPRAPERPSAPEPAQAAPSAPDASSAPAPRRESDPKLHGSSRTLLRRLRHGEIEPRAELDLHRRTRDQALNELGAFLKRSRQAGHEVVLVITGRGLHSVDLGVLREMIPLALQRRYEDHVRQVLPAPKRLGGEGAFVVFLRR